VGPSRSLAFRIIASSGAWLITALAVTALLLVNAYRDHTAQYLDAHVSIHLEELLDASRFDTDGDPLLAFEPSDPRYFDPYSGWYWEVRQSGETLFRSQSLGKSRLQAGDIQPTAETRVYEITGPESEKLRVHVTRVDNNDGRDPLVFLSTAPMTGFSDELAGYSNHIISSFLLLGAGLLLAVFLQVKVALRPLRAIKSDIARIREGKASKLPKSELEDVQTLVDELNNLLDHNAVLLKRARNQLGNLAHSVKNPLSVIKNEARSMPEVQGSLILKQTSDISKNIDHYLSQARTFGTEKVLGARCGVKTAVDDMIFVMRRIHKDDRLRIDCNDFPDCWFRGEVQDLEEVLGNLMDNACKWAESIVKIHVEIIDERLVITVEDDRPGTPADQVENVMKRGHRLDESKPGHGQGLGIVKDIVNLYGGQLTLGRSSLGGLQAVVNLPAA
jgi:signal transduction histidine kinase